MTWAAAAFVVVAFLVLLQVLAVPERAAGIVRRSRDALRIVRDASLGDDHKEAAMQAHAKALFVQFLIVTAASAIALVVPLALVFALDAAGIVGFDDVMTHTVSWPMLAGATLLGVLVLKWPRSRA